jgi:hypothetical protein
LAGRFSFVLQAKVLARAEAGNRQLREIDFFGMRGPSNGS